MNGWGTNLVKPVIWWVRKDLRLADNAALASAIAVGGPVIPVFILDEVFETYGAAPLWRFGLGVEKLTGSLEALGSRLVCRRGKATDVLKALVRETGAKAVRWSRAYDPDQVSRDKDVKAALRDLGVSAESLPGHLMFEPWKVETKTGGFYRVYSPFWRAVAALDVALPVPGPDRIPTPPDWPASERINDWNLGAAMRRGAGIVSQHVRVGEKAALDRLGDFVDERIDAYKDRRDFPAEASTSGLSENLAWGEISPAQCWHAARRSVEEGSKGGEHFLKELVWRECA